MESSIVFATNNPDKTREIQHLLGNDGYKVLSLNDLNIDVDIPEDEPTLEGNALFKANYVYRHFGYDCFADDTGLEVEALNGEPGVISARYAGEHKNMNDNIAKLLSKLAQFANKNARFRTIIALVINGEAKLFEGIVEGEIIHTPRGSGGFGYDPIFVPAGFQQTFAEMPLEIKNTISHRAKAINALTEYLKALTAGK